MDFSQLNLPEWALIILVIVNIFKEPITRILPSPFKIISQDRNRKHQMDEDLIEIIRDKEEFERSFYQSLVDTISQNTKALNELKWAIEHYFNRNKIYRQYESNE